MAVVAILFAVLCIVCACVESKVIAPYKWFHVFGRFKAYIALDFLIGGLVVLGGMIFGLSESTGIGGFPGVILGIVLLALAFLLYWTTLRKCPDMLKKKCLLSMIVVGLGVAMKICIFFIVSIWKIAGPKMVQGSDGEAYILYDGDTYLPNGKKVGHAGVDGFTVLKDDNGNPVEIG